MTDLDSANRQIRDVGTWKNTSDAGIGDNVEIFTSSCIVIEIGCGGAASRPVMANCRLQPSCQQMSTIT